MPLVIPRDMPAFEVLNKSAFVMDTQRANTQDIRTLEILILNLMPTKIETENQLLSLLANSPLQLNISFICTKSYVGKNTPLWHLEKFYQGIEAVKGKKFDGAIVTGAPVEQLEFENVKYWQELKEIFDFLRINVTSTMYICWGAMGALYHFYGIKKQNLSKKCFGVFLHDVANKDLILTNLDEKILMPHSRNSHIDENELSKIKDLKILLKNDEAGVAMLRDKKDIYILGHLEYFKKTLELEYERDNKTQIPKNYYDENGEILYNWRSNANTIFLNWLNYDVYQSTPYVL
ncbi:MULTISPECIES: homoserine O-succinyltransferase [unclassified Campylobacter]|uniref:homoserine O-succinyltransferase n=1 Tax=unclassified Campylobacter TaxID=2593542 RepID=UPI00123824FC|nr:MULTISPECIES: homoserine O-succinyltransferase [unclassified Campylobacter]KAA6226457.1 homoserine O-succinyltransferase [Campylobacter sp. LR185c]KAA6228593.1 homoserine O-succinyltransferase [Campylobacter sp. LR196d]KAA6229146.1 homoserine O-succinyltransferase [Campylobacter sp. LR286c]KAA6233937.1 homoserine O-succinyltransferase [Campylobacter sp. LR291e]KAA6234176.1 homoserine O-succinyltransferase [Campylobacter sp. LR264d]